MVPKKHELFRKKEVIKMIEFKGDLSKECRDYILNFHQLMSMIVVTFSVMPFIIADIVFSINKDLIFLIFMPIFVFIIVGAYFVKPKGELLEKMMEYYVAIDTENVIYEGNGRYLEIKIDDVKKIIDYGNFYKIKFYFPNTGRSLICQKSLITGGTIEDFEQLFGGLIVRKKSKK